MAKDYIDNDYVISYYSNSSQEYVTSYPSSSVVETVVSQFVTESVLNNYTWTEATGSNYDEWTIIAGTSEIAENNPNNSSNTMYNGFAIGLRNEIRGDEIYTNSYRSSGAEKNNGIVIYKSSSSGYALSDYINIPTSSYSYSTIANLAVEFSLDNNHLIVPIEKYYTDGQDGELLIYNSSSSGWSLETTLTTTDYNNGASINEDTDGRLAFWNAVVKDNHILAGIFTTNAGYYDDRYIAVFKSSSSGWQFQDQVQVAGLPPETDESGNPTETGGRIGNSRLNFDFDGSTGILGSKHANSSLTQPLVDSGDSSSGRVHVIKSGSSGWYLESELGLQNLGLTGAVDPSLGIPTSSYDGSTYPDWYTFQRFGLSSCAVSGNYIAATAVAKGFNAGGGVYHWRKDSVFILKSSSAGWAIEAQLEDPDPHFVSSGSYSSEGDAGFGYGLRLSENTLAVNSPTWRPDRDGDSGLVSGRLYIYHSTSAGGWSLGQTVDNLYSGSTFHDTTYEANEYFSGPEVPDGAGAAHFGSLPAISGNKLVIPAPEFTRIHDDSGILTVGTASASQIYGAVVVLEGEGSYVNSVSTEYVTQSTETITYVTTSGGPVPFRLGGSKNSGNIRDQDENNSYSHYKP